MSGFVKLTQRQIESKIDYIKDYTHSENPATGAKLDSNANVTVKNLTSMSCELNKDINIQVNRKILYNKISKLFDEDTADEYIRQLEEHEIYAHDETSLMPYCVAISMYPFLTSGMKSLGGESQAPKHLHSFCGSFVNLIYSIACQFAGAVATVEFLTYFDYFARKDYGDNYLKTNKKEVTDLLQQVVYCLNQPAGARNYQSTFWNISLFDKNYFDSLFGNFYFPDFTQPSWKSVQKLQNFFMQWFNEERTRALLTFPVVTAAMLVNEEKPVDEQFARDRAKDLSEGNSFFVYESNSVDSLSSCCFSKDTLVMWKFGGTIRLTTFDTMFEAAGEDGTIQIYHEGKWKNAKPIRLDSEGHRMFSVMFNNGKSVIMTDNHLTPTKNGDKRTDELTTKDYVFFSQKILKADPEKDAGMGYQDGKRKGAEICELFIAGGMTEANVDEIMTQSETFRRGVIDGYFEYMRNLENTEDVVNRPYSLIETIMAISATLGITTDDGECVRVKSITEIPYEGFVYCVECEDKTDPYFTLPNGLVTHNCRLRNELADNDFSYSLGAGGVKSGSINVITINFNRLIQNTAKSFMSEKEIDKETMLKDHKTELFDRIRGEVKTQVEKIQKYQTAYRSIMESYKAHKMLPVYDAGFIDLDKQFLTTGINGLVEGCEYLGFEISDNKDYKDFVSSVLKVIYDTDKAGKAIYGYRFNTEYVPAENLGVKNAKWDKEAGLEVPRDCYNSYFYKVEDCTLNEIDKFRLHGGDMIRYLDGGSALHLNLREYPDAEQYYQMMCIAAREGCNYWTTNIMTTVCESCGHIDKHTLEECPICGSKSISYATRIIGYLKKIPNFGKARQLEAAKRYYH